MCHRMIGCMIFEQSADLGNNDLLICTHQFKHACFNPFRALSHFAQDKRWDAQPGGFLLDASGIRKHQIGMFEQMDERR